MQLEGWAEEVAFLFTVPTGRNERTTWRARPPNT